LVGPEGEVIGVDKSPKAVALASQRAAEAGLHNVHFMAQDLGELTLAKPVEALIGRLVLMYFADPAVTLRHLSDLVQPGGLVVFHEIDTTASKSEPVCELSYSARGRACLREVRKSYQNKRPGHEPGPLRPEKGVRNREKGPHC
jgi:ubiquinone/menaquinone biosynthesis C-methylase UbiE